MVQPTKPTLTGWECTGAEDQEEVTIWPITEMTALPALGEHNTMKLEFNNEEFEQFGRDLFKFTKTWEPTDEQAWGDDEYKAISDEDEVLRDYELLESPVLIRDS